MKAQTTARLLPYIIFQRKKLILAVALSIIGTVLLGTLFWPRSYEAVSTVLIRENKYEHFLFPEPRSGGQSTLLIKPQEEINSEIEIIRSRPVLERVVKDLELDTRRNGSVPTLPTSSNLTGFETAVSRLANKLRVEPVVESRVIRIIYRDADPVVASQVVNKVAEEYLQQHLSIHLNREESGFYLNNINALEGEITSLRDQLAKIKNEESLISFSEQSAAFVAKLKTVDLARVNVQTEIASKRSKVSRIRQMLKSNPDLLIPMPEIAKNPIVEMLENKLVNLRFHLDSTRQRYTEDSRQVATARDQVEEVREQIQTQVKLFLEREMADLEKLKAEEQALTRTLNEVSAQIKPLASAEARMADLEKRIEDKQNTLTVVRERYQDALVAQGRDYRQTGAKIVSLSSVPLQPASPNIPLNMALGTVLAVIASLGLAFFVEYRDDSVKLPEDVERQLGVPLFASVPEL